MSNRDTSSDNNAGSPSYERVAPGDLLLDAANPRLVEYGLKRKSTQNEVLKCLWERMAVDEVAMSIAASGYWSHEPLFITEEGGKDVVIEGNRRLAAVRLLTDDKLRRDLKATDLPAITEKRRRELREVPVIRVGRRQDVWRYLGFKHVNGPAKWGSYAKAQYIAFVHNTADESLEHIATQIGDKHRTVQRLYRALMVIEQAERTGVWKRAFAYNTTVAFSHLTTALDYSGFQAFLKLSDRREESKEPVHRSRLKELGEICRWLWGDTRDSTPPLIQTQNPDLRRLDQALSSSQAVAALRLEQGLEAAFEVSKGDDIVFSEALQEAKNALMKAQGRVSSGYSGERHLLETAYTISEMAADLVDIMSKKVAPIRSPRRPDRADRRS